MAKKNPRPGRTLFGLLLVIALLYGGAALAAQSPDHSWKPGLGLDLEGGTRITLSAEGKAPSASQLKLASGIIDERVNGSGVTESEVSTQGSRNIVVEVPGKNARNLVDAVKQTAQLRFRLVASVAPGRPSASPSGSPSASPSPSASSSGKPSASPSAKSSSSSKSSATAQPKPRTAPKLAEPTASPSPSGRSSAKPSTAPTAQTSGAPASGASTIDDPLVWQDNPDRASVAKFAAYQCPAAGRDLKPASDNPDEPLITCDDDGNKFLLSKAIIEGTQLKTASFGQTQNSVAWAVQLNFKNSARKPFGDVTRKLAGTQKQFAIVLDGKVISYATVSQPILDGKPEITGDFTEASSRSLANQLKYGALPVKFAQPTIETIGPSLAGDQLSAGITAGVIGLLLVMLYCLIYYRGLGLVVIASLIVAAVITYATVLVLSATAGFTLTLPGIAGLIVAVGITADSFIVYFERIRDEMRAGRSMRVAVETGWARARNTCLAADAVSLIAAIVLYIFTIGVVKGFAFALGISTLIDLAVFFWFTKPMMTLLAKRRFFNSGHRFSGLSSETLGIDEAPNLSGGRA